MKTFAVIFCMGLATWLPAAPLTRPYVVEHYDVHLTPDLAAKRLAGEVTVRLTSRIDRLDAVELDAGALEIASVREGPAKSYFERKDSILIVVLASPAYKGEHRTLTIRYTAAPAKGLVFFPDQIYTSFFTSDWMPVDERVEDRATLRLTLDVPARFKVAASGVPQGNDWVLDTPTSAFLYAFAAGEFAENTQKVNGVTLRVLGKADVFDATASAMKFLTERSGEPYPGTTYTQIFTHGTVEQEAVGMTLLPETYAADLAQHPENLWLLAHELAHQWYGIQIPFQDWSDFWLSEGAATFMADAYLEQRFGRARYDREIAESKKTYDGLRTQGRDRPLFFTDWQTSSQAGGPLPYHKGAWFLSELRTKLTDDVFWRGWKAYSTSHWGRPTTSTDMEAAMQSALSQSGPKKNISSKELTKLFEQSVY